MNINVIIINQTYEWKNNEQSSQIKTKAMIILISKSKVLKTITITIISQEYLV